MILFQRPGNLRRTVPVHAERKDALDRLCKPVIKAAMPPFANENQLRSKAFSISRSNYNKNKRSSQCGYERKSNQIR